MGTVHRFRPALVVEPDRTEWQGRRPKVEPVVGRRNEPGVALRILAEAALIDAAFRADPPDRSTFDPATVDILMDRR